MTENWKDSKFAMIFSTGMGEEGEFELAADDADSIQLGISRKITLGGKNHTDHYKISVPDLKSMHRIIGDMLDELESSDRQIKQRRYKRLIHKEGYAQRLANDPQAQALFRKYTGMATAFDGACYAFAEALKRFLGLGGLMALGYIAIAPGYPTVDGQKVFGHVALLFDNYYIDGNGAQKISAMHDRWLGNFRNQPDKQPITFMLNGIPQDEIEDQLVTDEEFIKDLVDILWGYEHGTSSN